MNFGDLTGKTGHGRIDPEFAFFLEDVRSGKASMEQMLQLVSRERAAGLLTGIKESPDADSAVALAEKTLSWQGTTPVEKQGFRALVENFWTAQAEKLSAAAQVLQDQAAVFRGKVGL